MFGFVLTLSGLRRGIYFGTVCGKYMVGRTGFSATADQHVAENL